jgi:hypothetical protein
VKSGGIVVSVRGRRGVPFTNESIALPRADRWYVGPSVAGSAPAGGRVITAWLVCTRGRRNGELRSGSVRTRWAGPARRPMCRERPGSGRRMGRAVRRPWPGSGGRRGVGGGGVLPGAGGVFALAVRCLSAAGALSSGCVAPGGGVATLGDAPWGRCVRSRLAGGSASASSLSELGGLGDGLAGAGCVGA